MTPEQAIVSAILVATIAAFIWDRWRHDMVALAGLLACVAAGVVPTEEAFSGFGHPAVITVGCVLVLSRGLQTSGVVDILAQRVLPQSAGVVLTLVALTSLAAVLSAFMNNVGAMALLMPVALQIASRLKVPAGKILMPLSFGSILGGMTTLIGTPPNLIVSSFRTRNGAEEGFGMFDFTPVGLGIAAIGVAFVTLIGWRLVPTRERAGVEGFVTGTYLTEARIPEKSKAAGMSLREIEAALEEADAQVVGLIHNEVRIPAPNPYREARAGDILVIEAEPEALAAVLSTLGLTLVGDILKDEEVTGDGNKEQEPVTPEYIEARKIIQSENVTLMELAVMPNSYLAERSVTDVRLRARYGINLLAISRQGRRSMSRLRTTNIMEGDVLLMQGTPEALSEFAAQFGCVPLAERGIRLPDRSLTVKATGIMLLAVSGAAFGLFPAAIMFAAGVLASMALGVVSPRVVYDAVDWPVIILLAALIPVGGAVESTGAAAVIADLLLHEIAQGYPVTTLVLILIVTMTLSDFMNNAATAAVMCPIAIGAANQLGLNADPFLMAVAVGASCAFLTPIGHQNNTLILGPGGFRFGDYWRLGLPLEILVIAISVPMILLVWPL
jgi:di/tricarboxylate transporter